MPDSLGGNDGNGGAGIGYRFANGSDLEKLSNSDLSSWVGTVFFRWTEG